RPGRHFVDVASARRQKAGGRLAYDTPLLMAQAQRNAERHRMTVQLRNLAELPTEQDPRWAAVIARDRSADGTFYYSVSTTGIYCRPSCPARHAKPGHVRFHRTRAEAERAGFRPCKRCKPDQTEPDKGTDGIAGPLADLDWGAVAEGLDS